MDIGLVIVTHNSAGHISTCLRSAGQACREVVIVDNGSTDDTLAIVRREFPDVRIVDTRLNLGYGKAVNIGFRQLNSEYVILSNPDVVYAPSCIETMVRYLQTHANVGITAPQQTSPAGGWQYSYGDTPSIWTGIKDAVGVSSFRRFLRRAAWPRRLDFRPKEVGYVCGAVLALRSEVFASVNGFDEEFYFYGDESDLCLRLRKGGWKVIFHPGAQIVHIGGADSTRVDRSDKYYRFLTTSQAMLARKYLSPKMAWCYLWLEKICFQRLWLTCKLMKIFAFGKKQDEFQQRIRIMSTHVRLWGELLHEDRPSYAKALAKVRD